MKKSSDLFNLPIIALREGGEIGKVRDLVIDPQNRRIPALMVEDREWFRNPKVVLYTSIKALGDDAVIVETISDVSSLAQANELDPLLEQQVRILNTRCLSTEGRFMGRVSEFLIDTDTGRITGIEITSPSSTQKPILVPAESIITLTSDLAIIEEREAAARPQPQPTKLVDLPVASTEPASKPVMAAQEAIKPLREKEAPEFVPAKAAENKTRSEGGVRKVLEERQDAYLLGKEVRRDVLADDGNIIIRSGETISPEIIQRAKEADKYLALSFSIRRA